MHLFFSDEHVEQKHYCLDFSFQKQKHSESEDDVCYRKYAERKILFLLLKHTNLYVKNHTHALSVRRYITSQPFEKNIKMRFKHLATLSFSL